MVARTGLPILMRVNHMKLILGAQIFVAGLFSGLGRNVRNVSHPRTWPMAAIRFCRCDGASFAGLDSHRAATLPSMTAGVFTPEPENRTVVPVRRLPRLVLTIWASL